MTADIETYMIGVRAARAFTEADNNWQTELKAAFGSLASEYRYSRAGRGADGTPLNKAYLAREEARKTWQAHVNI